MAKPPCSPRSITNNMAWSTTYWMKAPCPIITSPAATKPHSTAREDGGLADHHRIIEEGCRPQHAAITRGTPLIEAALNGDTLSVEILLKAGAQVNCAIMRAGRRCMPRPSAWPSCDRPTVNATELKRFITEAKLLLDHGAAVDARADDGTTPLHILVRLRPRQVFRAMPEDEMRLLKLLLYYHANANTCRGVIPRHADANTRAGNGITPLHEAVWFGDRRSVEALLRGGARGNIPNKSGQTPLDYNDTLLRQARISPEREQVEKLLKKFAPGAGGYEKASVEPDRLARRPTTEPAARVHFAER